MGKNVQIKEHIFLFMQIILSQGSCNFALHQCDLTLKMLLSSLHTRSDLLQYYHSQVRENSTVFSCYYLAGHTGFPEVLLLLNMHKPAEGTFLFTALRFWRKAFQRCLLLVPWHSCCPHTKDSLTKSRFAWALHRAPSS